MRKQFSPPRASYLVVGLGNPGPEYEANRHNIGWWVLDALAGPDARFDKDRRAKAWVVVPASLRGPAGPILLAKPTTFMNNSGLAVVSLVRRYRIRLDRVLVLLDDVDLSLGRLRLRGDGGSAGHRGMRSVLQTMQNESVSRLRLGVGRPPAGQDMVEHVLSDFSREELPAVEAMVEQAGQAVRLWARVGVDRAMNEVNSWRPGTAGAEA